MNCLNVVLGVLQGVNDLHLGTIVSDGRFLQILVLVSLAVFDTLVWRLASILSISITLNAYFAI